MRYDQKPKRATQAKQKKTVFVLRVIGVIDQASALVGEDRLRVLERHAMLLSIGSGLPWVPLDAKGGHAHIVCTP